MHTPIPRAHACTQQAALAAAISFISGFEDDRQQSGVTELLAFLRQASAASTPPARAGWELAIPPIRPLFKNQLADSSDSIYLTDHQGNAERLHRRRVFPASWNGSQVPWHPSYWSHTADRTTANGQMWTHSNTLLCDDFGDLVPVSEEAALRPGAITC